MSLLPLLGFALAILPLALTPGASFTLVVSYADRGKQALASVIAGTGLGIFTHSLLAAIGLSAIVMRSAEVYRAVQVAGAIYLVILGISLLRPSKEASKRPAPQWKLSLSEGRGPVARAYIANVLNPKAAGIYLTLAPQFIPAHSVGLPAMLTLAATHVLIMSVWLSGIGLALSSVASRMTADEVLRCFKSIGEAVLVLLGIRSLAATAAQGASS